MDDDGAVKALQAEAPNRARDIIESFMVAANGVTARFLTGHGLPSIRRVVRVPETVAAHRRDCASALGTALPAEPDSRALEKFLRARRAADPDSVCGPLAEHPEADGARRVRGGRPGRG